MVVEVDKAGSEDAIGGNDLGAGGKGYVGALGDDATVLDEDSSVFDDGVGHD